MNFGFAEKINHKLEALDFEGALEIAVRAMEKLSVTKFHEVLGLTFTNQTEEVAAWVDDFYKLACAEGSVEALYFEMNEFDINTDIWFIDGFSFSEDGGLDLEDSEHMDWLSDYDAEAQNIFTLTGFEKLQISFSEIEKKEINGDWTDNQQDARDWCEQIVISKFMKLMRDVHKLAKEQQFSWSEIPIYSTVHGYDFVVRSENNQTKKNSKNSKRTFKWLLK